MSRVFDEGIDDAGNAWLASLPTPNKLYIWLCDEEETDVSTTDVLADLTQTAGSSVKSVTGLTCSARIIDLGVGGIFDWTELTGTPRSFVVSTDDPATPGAKLVLLQDIDGGATVALPFPIDGVTVRLSYDGEA
jgi:hypothetical protein